MFIMKALNVIYRLHDNALSQHIINSPTHTQLAVKQQYLSFHDLNMSS